VNKEMYIFEDRSRNKLALRPEVTASVCRAYIEHGMQHLPQPVRLYYIGPAFRYERPQAGRYREHHQLGAEAIGESNPALDAEVMDMAYNFLNEVGGDFFLP
jgi:histidyl-tRNA synthetase